MEVKQRVYLETTIASYLTARPSRDVVVTAHQELTNEWWDTQRARFDLYISELVMLESSRGDPAASLRRIGLLAEIPILETNEAANQLAASFLASTIIPEKAAADALHVAIATTQAMDYLLTWNCRHIANAEIIERLRVLALDLGYRIPTLCTPEQLMGK